jgi:hypothetical protein
MELTRFQRIAAFGLIVLVLTGLGVYLVLPAAAGSGPSTPAPTTPAGQPPAQTPSAQPTPAPTGLPTASASLPPGTPDIYQWLPFSPAGLASAARLAVTFGADYGTFSYSEKVSAYLAPMRRLISSQLAAVIGRAFSAPGVTATRVGSKQVSSGSAGIVSLRAFGPSSLTFVETITERITDSKGQHQQSADYAVTLTGGGTSWQVSDIELASAGNL